MSKHLFEQLYLNKWFHWNSKFKTLISEVTSEQQCYNVQMVALFMINKKLLKYFFHVAKILNFVTSQFQFWNLVYWLCVMCKVPMHHGYRRWFSCWWNFGGVEPYLCEILVPNISSSNIENVCLKTTILLKNEVLQFITIGIQVVL